MKALPSPSSSSRPSDLFGSSAPPVGRDAVSYADGPGADGLHWLLDNIDYLFERSLFHDMLPPVLKVDGTWHSYASAAVAQRGWLNNLVNEFLGRRNAMWKTEGDCVEEFAEALQAYAVLFERLLRPDATRLFSARTADPSDQLVQDVSSAMARGQILQQMGTRMFDTGRGKAQGIIFDSRPVTSLFPDREGKFAHVLVALFFLTTDVPRVTPHRVRAQASSRHRVRVRGHCRLGSRSGQHPAILRDSARADSLRPTSLHFCLPSQSIKARQRRP